MTVILVTVALTVLVLTVVLPLVTFVRTVSHSRDLERLRARLASLEASIGERRVPDAALAAPPAQAPSTWVPARPPAAADSAAASASTPHVDAPPGPPVEPESCVADELCALIASHNGPSLARGERPS